MEIISYILWIIIFFICIIAFKKRKILQLKSENLIDTLDKKIPSYLQFFVLLVGLTVIMMLCFYPLKPGHDFYFHYRRLDSLINSLISGTFPSYIDYSALDGYGYLIKTFYSDFVLIPFAIIGIFTGKYIAYQITIFTITILCGVAMYYVTNFIFKNKFAATIGSLSYTFVYYRIIDLYPRATLGETITFTIIPLIILGTYHAVKGNKQKWYILTIAFSLMMFTHLVSTILTAIFVLIYMLISYKSFLKNPKRILYILLSVLFTILITSYYTIPLIEQMLSDTFYYNTRDIVSSTQNKGLKINWIFWGFFAGFIQQRQELTPGTGVIMTMMICSRMFITIKNKKLHIADIFLLTALLVWFACSSFFPWYLYPFKLLNFIQFPWRLLQYSSLFFALAGAYYLSVLLKTKFQKIFCLILFSILTTFTFANYGNFMRTSVEEDINDKPDFYGIYQLGGFEYIPDKVPSIGYVYYRNQVVTCNKNSDVSKFNNENGIVTFSLNTNSADTFELPLLYYKGYVATIDGKDIPVYESENGLIQINSQKSGNIKVWYKGTMLQKLSLYITLISIFAFITIIFLKKNKKKKLLLSNNSFRIKK